MPSRDGTGPMGRRSSSGRGMSDVTKDVGSVRGLGLGLGSGCRGGSKKTGFCNVVKPQNQKDLLLEQKVILENRLKSLNEQLNTL